MMSLIDLIKKKNRKNSESEFSNDLDTMFEFEKEMKKAGGC